jgi:hypothetical protein
LMACNVASLHAAPLPTNLAAMKSMVADSSIQVRWGSGYWGFGGWRHRGWLASSWKEPRNRQPSPSDTTDLTTDTTGGAGAIGKAGTSVSPGSFGLHSMLRW